MTKNPVIDARALVAELFPHALWAVLTGSVITPARTAGSDLDIVVLLPDGDPRAPHRDSRRFRGRPVELFVHDEPSLAHYLARELGARKPTLHRMVGTGVALVGDPGHWQETCAKVLAGGPPPLSVQERRRQVTAARASGSRSRSGRQIACRPWGSIGDRGLRRRPARPRRRSLFEGYSVPGERE